MFSNQKNEQERADYILKHTNTKITTEDKINLGVVIPIIYKIHENKIN